MDLSAAGAALGFARWTGTSALGRFLTFRVALCRPLHPGAPWSSPLRRLKAGRAGLRFRCVSLLLPGSPPHVAASAPSLTCLRLRCLCAPCVPVLVAFGSEPMSLDGAAANPRLPVLQMHVSVTPFQSFFSFQMIIL